MKKLLVIVAAVVIVLFLAKDFVAGFVFTSGIKAFTDLPASVKGMKVGVFKSAVDIDNLKVYNPKNNFKDRVMLDIPDFYVHYDLWSMFSGKKHIKKMRLDLKEFYVIKNEGGELNIDSLKAIQSGGGKQGAKQAAKQDMKFMIDELDLKIGKVIYKDYTKGGSPSVKEFNVGIEGINTNIVNSMRSLACCFKALANHERGFPGNFDLNGLKAVSSEAMTPQRKRKTGGGRGIKKVLHIRQVNSLTASL
jgi:hypothetical protein